MLAKILGIIWIILGVWWLLKPDALKRRLQRKMSRRVRWTVFGFLFIFGIMMTGSVFKTPGVLPKVIGIIGLIIAIRAIVFITSKASEKILSWWGERPIIVFRVWGLLVLGMGVMLFFAEKGG